VSHAGRIAIIGAGPAGLTAAYRLSELGHRVDVFEASQNVGGLARSITLWGTQVDLGSHIFHLGIPEIDRIWHETLGDRQYFLELKRGLLDSGRIHQHPFDPFKLFATLGVTEIAKCALSWAFRERRSSIKSAEDLIISRYGRRAYDRLLRTYIEKLWGTAGSELDASFAQSLLGSVPTSPGSALVNAAHRLIFRQSKESRSSLFPYPVGGTGALWRGMADKIRVLGGEIHLLAKVDRVVIEGRRVQGLEIGETVIGADFVISSLPLPTLYKAITKSPILPTAMKPRSTILVYLDLSEDEKFPGLWLYLLDKGVCAGRVTNVSAWNPGASPKGYTKTLCIEYSCDAGDPLWISTDQELASQAEREMQVVGIMKSSAVLRWHIERLRSTHPGHHQGSADWVQQAKAEITKIERLWSVGRHGTASLAAMSDAMGEGYQAAETIHTALGGR